MAAIAVLNSPEIDLVQQRFLDTYWSDWEIVCHEDTLRKKTRWAIRTSTPITQQQRLLIDAMFPQQTHRLQV